MPPRSNSMSDKSLVLTDQQINELEERVFRGGSLRRWDAERLIATVRDRGVICTICLKHTHTASSCPDRNRG